MHIGKRKTRNKKEDSPHLYDEIQNKFSKAIDDEDEIVFYATTLHAHTHNESLYDIADCYVQSPNEGTLLLMMKLTVII